MLMLNLSWKSPHTYINVNFFLHYRALEQQLEMLRFAIKKFTRT